MKPVKAEIDALRDVLLTPLTEFISAKEAESRTQEKAEALAQTRMFTAALEAVDIARADRTYFMVVLRHGSASVTYSGFGPYSTKDQAEKAAAQALAGMEITAYAIVPTRNHHGLGALFELADAPAAERSMWELVKQDGRAVKRGWRGNKRDRNQYLDAS